MSAGCCGVAFPGQVFQTVDAGMLVKAMILTKQRTFRATAVLASMVLCRLLAPSRTIRWFVNEEYLGASASGMPFFWSPRPGSSVVRAVVDLGRAAHREVTAQIVE